MTQTNFNISPYYDDFDKNKNFHQILFKPGYSVQARELTQLQQILKNQIAQFGNHIFKHGQIVIPGNSRGELQVHYAMIDPVYNYSAINIAQFEGKTIFGQTSGVKAIVTKISDKTSTEPITFFLNYISGGVIDGIQTGKLVFDPGEILTVLLPDLSLSSIRCNISSSALTTSNAAQIPAIGVGSLAYVNSGVYYINGTFVHVDTQQVVLSKYSSLPQCHVLLQIVSEIVTADIDATLLDPAHGSYNYAADGADRHKLQLKLTTLEIDSQIQDDYVEIMRYRLGVLEEHARNPKYNELEKSLARRTFDESGDYVVDGLIGAVSEHRRENNNGGIYDDGSVDKFAIAISPGKAYIRGFEVEKISPTLFSLDKARTSIHLGKKDLSQVLDYGKYIFISDVIGDLGLATKTKLTIKQKDGVQTSTDLATIKIVGIDYFAGSGPDTVFKAYYTDLTYSATSQTITNAYELSGIGSDNLPTSAKVIHKLQVQLTNNTTISSGAEIAHVIAQTTQYSAIVKYHDRFNQSIFVFKTSTQTKNIPTILGSVLSITSTTINNITLKSVNSFGQNVGSNQLPIFKLPAKAIAKIKPNGSTLLSYVVQMQFYMTVTVNTSGEYVASYNLTGGNQFYSLDQGLFCAFGATGIAINQDKFTNTSTSLAFVQTTNPGNRIQVFCSIKRPRSIYPRTKTAILRNETLDKVGNQYVLQKSDAYQILSVKDVTNLDITPQFTLVTGHTDYFYNRSKLISTYSQQINVQYMYYEHGAGDFFQADSYPTSQYAQYKTQAGDIINLRNCLDFRATSDSQDNTKYNSISAMPVHGTLFESNDSSIYLGRYDAVVVNKNGTVQIINGTPQENPTIPRTPSDQLLLENYFIPPYTDSITDIVKHRYAVGRHTMSDISKLKDRLYNLEEFSTLSAAETALMSYDVTDAQTGLRRFKTGYLVEQFASPLTIADITQKQFNAAFDQGDLIAQMDTMMCPLTQSSDNLSTNIVVKNDIAMLPYTESVFAQQNVSQRVTNLNPFMIVKWNGTLTVTPSRDSWTETLDLPTVYTTSEEVVTIVVWIPAPVAPSTQSAPPMQPPTSSLTPMQALSASS